MNFRLPIRKKQRFELVSSAFALLFTEISVVRVAEISVNHTTEISVKSSVKAEDTS